MLFKMKQKSRLQKMHSISQQKLTQIGKINFYAEFELDVANNELIEVTESELSTALIQAYVAGIESTFLNCNSAY